MRPDPLPVLTGKCAKEFEKEIAEPIKHKEIETFQKAMEVYKGIKKAKKAK